jgi:hypothetical protein
MDRRVTARTKARARAARPASWAPAMGAPSGSAVVFAIERVCVFRADRAEFEVDFGSRVGNKPAALPPGLRVERAAAMPGRLATASGDVTDTGAWGVGVAGGAVEVDEVFEVFFGVGGAVMATAVDATGSVGRLAALPMAVRLTDVTVEAVTVSCAWSGRCADCASTAPRSHEDVPSPLPQPLPNFGAPPAAGVASSWMVASGTFPPVVQAVTVHWAE